LIVWSAGTKLCTSCHCSKPLDRFYTAGRHKAGGVRYHSHCKSCKLGNEATLRMQPRKGSQEVELSEATAGEACVCFFPTDGPSFPMLLLPALVLAVR